MTLSNPFLSWPSFTTEEAEAIQKVLLSNKVNYWTGQECRLFEKEFADWCGTTYVVALANGTLALDVALDGAVDPEISPGRVLHLFRLRRLALCLQSSPDAL